MGRRRRRQQERLLAEALARAAATGAEEGRREGLFSVLLRIARGLLLRDTQDAVRMLEERGPEATLRGLGRLARDVWEGRWRDALAPVLEEVMDTAPLQTDRGPVRLGFDLANPMNAEFFEGYRIRLSGQVTNTTREKLEAAIREGIEEGLSVPEVAEKVSQAGEEFAGYRSELIARTELHRAALESAEMQAKRSGVVDRKTWRATMDARTREEHRDLDGKSVRLEETWGGRHPATEINCRCYVEYGIDMGAVRGEVA